MPDRANQPLRSDDESDGGSSSGDESDAGSPPKASGAGGGVSARKQADLELLTAQFASPQRPPPPPPAREVEKDAVQADAGASAVWKNPKERLSTGSVGSCFTPDGSEHGDPESRVSSRSSDLAEQLLLGGEDEEEDQADEDDDEQADQAPAAAKKKLTVPAVHIIGPAPSDTSEQIVRSSDRKISVESRVEEKAEAKMADVIRIPAQEFKRFGDEEEDSQVDLVIDDETDDGEAANCSNDQQQEVPIDELPLAPLGGTAASHTAQAAQAPQPQAAAAAADKASPSHEQRRDKGKAEKTNLLDMMGSAVESVEREQRETQGTDSANSATNAARSAHSPAPVRCTGKVSGRANGASTELRFQEMQTWMFGLAMEPDMLLQDNGFARKPRCGCFGGSAAKSPVPGLHKMLWSGVDFVLFLRSTPFSFKDSMHARMLQRVFDVDSASAIQSVQVDVGFQNIDPLKDLNRDDGNGNGVLNVVHMFVFLSLNPDLFNYAYTLSSDKQFNFPFASISLALTQIIVEALMAGHLSQICNTSQRGVFDNTCDMYAASLLRFCSLWRRRGPLKNSSDTALANDRERALKEVCTAIAKKPAKLLEELRSLDSYQESSAMQ